MGRATARINTGNRIQLLMFRAICAMGGAIASRTVNDSIGQNCDALDSRCLTPYERMLSCPLRNCALC